jgi:DNA-binding ferritin-like protein
MKTSFDYDPEKIRDLAECLRSVTAAMGFAMAAYNKFTQLKSVDVSPDGKLGGKGYIQNIVDMRRQLTNIVEALSSISDTLYDEVNAPHWALASRTAESKEAKEDKREAREYLKDTQEIRQDPERWAEQNIETTNEKES